MRRPAGPVLAAFVLVVLIGGSNFVAVRFSNRELPPFWGAGLRFAIAGALLLLFARWRRIPLPRGRGSGVDWIPAPVWTPLRTGAHPILRKSESVPLSLFQSLSSSLP